MLAGSTSTSIAPVGLSVVVPCYNEAEVMGMLHPRLSAACRDAMGNDYEIVYVNDGSRDATWSLIEALSENDPHVVGVNLSRNFGHQLAVTAGLAHTVGERVLIIDADLQDPPELLKPMLARMEAEQADVVYGQRIKRNAETAFKKATAALFYRVFRRLTDLNMPADTGDFRLITRRVVHALQQMPEQARFLRGMVTWVGYRQVPFEFERAERAAGVTKYPLRKMIKFATDAITGYSIAPLRFASHFAMVAVPISFLLGVYVMLSWMAGRTVDGWTSLFVVVVFFGSVQLMVLGIIGEYIGRIVLESKRRPLFLVERVVRAPVRATQGKLESVR